MTSRTDQVGSLYDEMASDPKGARELAAAELTMDAQGLLERAFRSRKDVTQADLAEQLGVTEGRVSQVLNADSVTNLALLARYMHALGYELELNMRPIGSTTDQHDLQRAETGGELTATAERGAAQVWHVYQALFASSQGTHEGVTVVGGVSPAARLFQISLPDAIGSWILDDTGEEIFAQAPNDVREELVTGRAKVMAARP